jgi:hypothetical protein
MCSIGEGSGWTWRLGLGLVVGIWFGDCTFDWYYGDNV